MDTPIMDGFSLQRQATDDVGLDESSNESTDAELANIISEDSPHADAGKGAEKLSHASVDQAGMSSSPSAKNSSISQDSPSIINTNMRLSKESIAPALGLDKEDILVDSAWLERNVLNWTSRHPREDRWNESYNQIKLQLLSCLPNKDTSVIFVNFSNYINSLPNHKELLEALIKRFSILFDDILGQEPMDNVVFNTQFQALGIGLSTVYCSVRAGMFIFRVLQECHHAQGMPWVPCQNQESADEFARWISMSRSLDEEDFKREVMPFCQNLNLQGLTFTYLTLFDFNADETNFSQQKMRFVRFLNSTLSRCDFRDGNFYDVELKNTKMISSDWTKSNLEIHVADSEIIESNFSNVTMNNSEMIKCSVSDTNFQNSDMSGLNLLGSKGSSCNFNHSNMDSAIMRDCDFNKSTFQSVQLRKCVASYSKFNECDFSDSNLNEAVMNSCEARNAIFRKALVKEANLYRANLEGSDFSGGNLTDVYLNNANLTKAIFNEAIMERTLLRDTRMEECQLVRANLTNVDLTNARLIKANLEKANMTGAILKGANMEGANFSGAHLLGVDLSGAQLEGATMTNVDFAGVKLTEARLKNANLSGNDLSKVDLAKVDMRGADLSRCYFEKVDLRHAQMSKANLTGTLMRGARLNNAKLSGANLSRADLREADLRGSDLTEKELRKAHSGGAMLADALFHMRGVDYYCKVLQEALIFVKVPSRSRES